MTGGASAEIASLLARVEAAPDEPGTGGFELRPTL